MTRINRRKDLDYRLDKDTYEALQYDLVEKSKRWDSRADFTREAINEHAESLARVASGGRLANRLVRLLSDVRGIQEEEKEPSKKPKIEGRNLKKSTTAKLPLEDFNSLNELSDEISVTVATAAGYCIFRHLNGICSHTDYFDSSQERNIIQTWTELNNGLIEPKLNLHQVLTKRFRLHETTTYFIQRDPQPFTEFAEVYHDQLYNTQPYNRLHEIFGSKTFNNVENTIEENTDFTFLQESGSDDNYKVRVFTDEDSK